MSARRNNNPLGGGKDLGKGKPLPTGSDRLIKIKFKKELSETAMDRRIAPRPRQRVQIVNRKVAKRLRSQARRKGEYYDLALQTNILLATRLAYRCKHIKK